MTRVRRHASAAAFLALAEPWLLFAEAENNLLPGELRVATASDVPFNTTWLDGTPRSLVAFCSLHIDLANPTSNSIHQRIGYVPVGDVIDCNFE